MTKETLITKWPDLLSLQVQLLASSVYKAIGLAVCFLFLHPYQRIIGVLYLVSTPTTLANGKLFVRNRGILTISWWTHSF